MLRINHSPLYGSHPLIDHRLTAKGGISGSTSMLRRLASTSLASKFIDLLLVGTGLLHLELVKQIVQRQLPDMTIFYANGQGALPSNQLNPLLYHELGHTQHYNQVGNNFWTAYIAHIVQHLGYGEKSDSGSGRIAISEGWGNYTEQLFTIDKYQGTASRFLANSALRYLEYQAPSDIDYQNVNDGWFVYGMYHDMTDNTIEPTVTRVTDNVTIYTPASVFRGLQPSVLTVRDYQARVNLVNNGIQSFQMGQLVSSYRW